MTIQAAVNAAAPGAIINVDAGTYPELVTVNKSVTLRGPQAGVDARSNIRAAGSNEAIVNGTALSTTSRSTGFYITANDVTIDGFTVTGSSTRSQYGAGIVIAPSKAGTHIYNNVVSNNWTGIFLSNNSATDACIIQHNSFKDNYNPADGNYATSGNDNRQIYSDAYVSGGLLTNVKIDGNAFWRSNLNADFVEGAIGLESYTPGSQTNISITNNTMDAMGKGVLAYNVQNITVSGNIVTHVGDYWSGIFRDEGNVQNATISGNTFYDAYGPVLKVDNRAMPGDSSGFVLNDNNFYNNGYSIVSGAGSFQTANGYRGSVVILNGTYSGGINLNNNWWGSATGPGGVGPGSGDPIVSGSTSATYTPWATTPFGSEDLPYWGIAATDGAPVQFEDYNHGGEGIAYHDTTNGDQGGKYRFGESVDINTTTDTGGGYMVQNAVAGEWLDYSVTITQTSTYRLDVRLANTGAGGVFHVMVDGVNATGAITVGSGGWQTLSENGLSLTAGQHLVRVVMDTNSSAGTVANFNWLQFTTSGTPAPSAPTGLVATATSSSQINLAWNYTGTAPTGFKLDRSTDGINFTTIATLGASAVTYGDTSLAAGSTYAYRIRAYNSTGDSANSAPASATTLSTSATSTYLSDLTWASATSGYGSVTKDKTVSGNTLTLNGTTYAKGLGTHAVSNIVYNLNGQYSTFTSDVGVDDEEDVKGVGTVDFQVIGDGKVLFDSGNLTNSGAPAHVNISVAGVQQLTLVANNGIANSIDYDHADWAGAQLLGTAAAPTAPAALAATALSASSIKLTWTTTSSNQIAFAVDRSTDGTNFTTVATNIAASASSWTDTSVLSASTKYYYRIRATNAVGASPNSNVASATTLSLATVTYISDLPWTSATVGYGTIQKDKSIKGNPLTLNGVVYAKGLGTHAVSNITYNLAGKYSTFLSDIGIDDEELGVGVGSVDFQVLADGKVIFDSGILKSGSPTVSINVSVANVQTLTLVATNGVAGSIDYDHADWAGARLLV